jgi:site-specific recombinase XerD
LIEDFKRYLKINGVSKVTIKSYILKIKEYIQWYQESFGLEFSKLYRENVLDYLSYLQTVKKNNAKTINTKVSALIKFNEFLCECCIQEKMIINKNDRIRIQEQLVSPTKISKQEVE